MPFPSRFLRVPLALAALAGCTPPPPSQNVDAAVAPTDAAVDTTAPNACTRAPVSERDPDEGAFRGLSAPVEVLRDSLGIPHIYARTDDDVFFASGYVQATDRLFQMELVRRAARGTAASFQGPGRLSQDRIVRLMGVPHWGRESAARVRREHPEVHRLAVAWVAGVNRRVGEIRAGRAPLPTGFRELGAMPSTWTSDDPYLISRLILFRNANSLDFDLLATVFRRYVSNAMELPLYQSLTDAFIVPPEERPRTRAARARPAGIPREVRVRTERMLAALAPFRRGASNNWAVAGRHSANGRPLLAGDPHQPLQSPSVFWAQHMDSASAGGSFDVVGFAFAGAPGVHLGHNRRVAWTATTAYPDTMDAWEVPYDTATVTYGGRRLPVARCTETIPVRGGDAETYVVEEVAGVGVLLPDNLSPLPVTDRGNRLLFRWAGFLPTAEAEVFFAFDRARDVNDFEAAVRRMEIGSFNFIAADARDILYRSRVLLPDRGETRGLAVPNAVLDGTDARTLWSTRLLPDDRQPHGRGAQRGFLLSANNDPFGFTANGRIDDDPWYYGVWFDPGTRAARIERELTRLSTAGGITPAQLQTLQLDSHDLLADELLPALFAAWEGRGRDPALAPFRDDATLAALVEELTRWDRRMDRRAAAPVIFEAWQHFLARQVFSDDLSALFDAVLAREPVYVMKLLALVINGRFPGAARFLQQGREVLLVRSLAATRDWLAQRFGGPAPAGYDWGRFHFSRALSIVPSPSPFDVEPVATDGSVGTVNVSSAQFFTDTGVARRTMESHSGAVYRMVAGFDEDGTPRAEVNFVRGNVAEPASRWYGNTHEDWVAGRYRALRFRRADVEADVQERTTLMP